MLQEKCPPIKTVPFGCSARALRKTQKHFMFSVVLSAWFVLLFCSTELGNTAELKTLSRCSVEADSSVSVEHSSQWNATIYNIINGDCSIKWIARYSEIGVIKHWSQCKLSLADQLPLLTKIGAEFFRKDVNAQAFRTLFWGRLEPDHQNASRELSFRLALAAHKSPGWDIKKGKPKKGDINGFVRDLANKELIYPELRELFERFHKSLQFSCAEKVLVQKAEKLSFFDQLKRHGVKAEDKLPFDCMTWFSVADAMQR